METPPFPETRIGGETAEEAKQGGINWVAQCSIGTIAPQFDEVIAQ